MMIFPTTRGFYFIVYFTTINAVYKGRPGEHFLGCAQLLLVVQGQSRQTGFFELALRDRNMQVRFFWKVFLEF